MNTSYVAHQPALVAAIVALCSSTTEAALLLMIPYRTSVQQNPSNEACLGWLLDSTTPLRINANLLNFTVLYSTVVLQ